MNLKLSIVNYPLTILLLLFFALPVKAQVTIGAQQAPHSYSLLELATAKGGLRLPMLKTSERDALKLTSDSTEAGGLVIYNTDIDCVEFWSDGKWIDLCSATPASSIVNSIKLTSAAGTDAQTVCGGTAITPITYSTTGATGATFVGLPAGVTGNWNAGLVTIGGAPTTSGNYIVVLTGGSGSGMAIGTITVNKVISAIAGANGVTKGATGLTYSVTPVSGVTTYTWTVPSGWSITKGQGSDSITVTAGTTEGHAGTITVSANNGNCTSTSTLAVSVGCPVKTTNGNWLTFMCYNLGASASVQNLTPTDQANAAAADNYGDLYQWGRIGDNHQIRTSGTVAGPMSGANLDATTGQVIGANAGKFITNDTTPYDWRNPQRDTLWYNSGKTVNDPCPSGWRVPTATELQSIVNGNTTQVTSIPAAGTSGLISGNKWVWSNTTTPGWLITPTGSTTPTLFLPAAGYRYGNTGAINYEGTSGYYWSSSVNSTNAYLLNFASTNLGPGYTFNRASGLSVRCVSE